MPVDEHILKKVLSNVQKPARYLGNEWNSCHKDHEQVKLKMVFAFPDLYEVGMSNQGLKILYDSVNRNPELLMERVFAPADDMEGLLREHGLPLFALESREAIGSFDLVGFSLQYELSFTNIINMLDLSGLPLYSDKRDEQDPLVIGGGPCAYNPEPLAPFFDFFVIGEAEEVLPEILTEIVLLKEKGLNKRDLLIEISTLEGVYVPSLYHPVYNKEKIFQGLKKLESRAPDLIKKRHIEDLDQIPYPTTPIVSYIETIHDRAVVELFRGCARGCRFCQAGYTFRPVRKRSHESVVNSAGKIIDATGYDEIALSSLSSTDYPDLEQLINKLVTVFPAGRIKCSLPSLRLDSYSVKLADQLHRGRRSSLTFAPEAATERLRKVIRKNLSEEDIFKALADAVKAGWQGFKLYFMIGLPTEREEDIEAIPELCFRIRQFIKKQEGRSLKISVSVSTFVPKAHTPFQWEPQLSLEHVVRRQEILKKGFSNLPGVEYSWHDAEASMLEAVYARGDRRLAPVLERAWQLGCRFDGWSEHFSFDSWKKAFHDTGIDPEAFAYRHFNYDQPLPWDHIDCGVKKEVFIGEHHKAMIIDSKEGGANGTFEL